MKITKDTAQSLAKNVRANGREESLADDALTYTLDDMTMAFMVSESGKQSFAGLSFEMIGRDFHILPNLEIMLSEYGEDGEEVYSLEDEKFSNLVNTYLTWRANVLETIQM